MKKITVSVPALFLALGVLSGCGEKKEEAPKAEAPAAEQKPAEQAAAPAVAPAPEQAAPATTNPMNAMADAASSAAGAVSDAAKATADAAGSAAASATQAVGDAAKATAETATNAADATKQAAADAVDATKQAATDATAAAAPVDGEKVYKGLCFSCHDMGVAGAPKMGDKAAWAPRIATGNEALYTTALKGKGAMPAKGGNPALSDAEVKVSVDYMVSKNK